MTVMYVGCRHSLVSILTHTREHVVAWTFAGSFTSKNNSASFASLHTFNYISKRMVKYLIKLYYNC